MAYEDSVGTAYDDIPNIETAGLDAGGPGLSTSEKELDFPSLDEQYEERFNRGKIPIPKYMKGDKVEELHEE